MTFFGLDINLFEILIIINAIVCVLGFFVIIQGIIGMRRQEKEEYIASLKYQQRQRQAQQGTAQHQRANTMQPTPHKNGNDLSVLTKNLRPPAKSAAQKIGDNIGV